jgi:hypothetical protein
MDQELRRVYLDEIMHRCDICHAAMMDLEQISAEVPMCRNPFRPAAELIYNAAVISKLFWPPRSENKHKGQRASARGEYLRSLLGIEDNHPIRDRTLRNHLEHYDERLDAWAEQARKQYVAHQLIAPMPPDPNGFFVVQHYDPATKTFAFRGEPFDVFALGAAALDIYSRTKRARRQKHGV